MRVMWAETRHPTMQFGPRLGTEVTWGWVGSDVHFIFSPGKFQAPYFMCALANFTEIS